MHLQPTDLRSLIKEPKTHDEEKTASATNASGKIGYPHIED
jgi:hypothetical protein